ncbi:unnamed protein product [Rotaria magnacalcarata]|uniref:Uncharacterized protein n=1 Tax=Rotaria magnacalcarata TaxID=392030 RepID=A0A819JAE1_9BILA|nr:unnamed protein product [Rotaria magnacalcarata]CAF3808063.1 unnamed protein product [Rotaria magnacalcarata]CAF3829364.1 unnamed protein product [Rotaria magnacalcarata]CAF3929903.1 unnamed protein product [Rotaria magnacalcarata]
MLVTVNHQSLKYIVLKQGVILHICKFLRIVYRSTMKRHHEDNPYSLTDNGGGGVTSHSMPKRIATRHNSPSESIIIIRTSNTVTISGNYSPPSSTSSDSSSSTNSTSSLNSIHSQLCTCPNIDCVIHDRRRSTNLPVELTSISNPTYANNNLLLYYAHLERCRRHGQNIHQDTHSS